MTRIVSRTEEVAWAPFALGPCRNSRAGQQQSLTARRNRTSPAVQLKQQAGRERAIRIVVPKVGGSSPLGHSSGRGTGR
jgi:hypothetical protein